LDTSRRTLERRFLAALGHSPAGHIRLVRIELARGLLRDTGLPVEDVAVRCGFTSATRLGEVFRRHVGMTPSRYRAESRR
jgi:transcriptional regulator GlxA family with amidase domain